MSTMENNLRVIGFIFFPIRETQTDSFNFNNIVKEIILTDSFFVSVLYY